MSKVYIAELKRLVALSGDAVPSAVLSEGDAEVCGSSFATTRRSQRVGSSISMIWMQLASLRIASKIG